MMNHFEDDIDIAIEIQAKMNEVNQVKKTDCNTLQQDKRKNNNSL